ncbi:LacI family DNA-binding transcriptional regulator [Streptomyces pratensis]|uniref:LacI family DNA-binding transcriptional regulator n=1 Tax=Streptomyces pratensis TaxID=1169025 RepID=UPI00363BA268
MTREASTRRPTIRDVARLAGVSHQTVSRFLRADRTIGEELRERIGQAIAQLDYRPNLVARAMRDNRTGRLALLVPAGTAVSSLEVLTGAAAASHEAGYVVEVVTLGGAPESRTARVLDLADSGLFEGMLSLTPLPQLSARRQAGGIPVVIEADYDERMRGIGDLADASTLAEVIERLAEQGHRRFLHAAGDYAHTSARLRRQVYLETVERLGLESYAVADCDWLADRARQAVLGLPADCGVTAVVCANDLLAAGAVRGAVERGWRVPADLSVTGWDDNPLGAAMMPSLTTVAVDHERLGRRAVRRLLAELRGVREPGAGPGPGSGQEPGTHGPGGDQEPDGHDLITSVVWRESTAPAPGHRPAPGTTGRAPATRAAHATVPPWVQSGD